MGALPVRTLLDDLGFFRFNGWHRTIPAVGNGRTRKRDWGTVLLLCQNTVYGTIFSTVSIPVGKDLRGYRSQR